MKIKQIFNENTRIVALAGNKNEGKTNNLVYLLEDFRKENKLVPIYVYGMPKEVIDYLKKLNIKEISSLKHLIDKKNCILILDEVQKLKLNDRRYKDELNDFVDFVYHNNVYVILSSPNLREFNTVIGGVIEGWLLKSTRKDMCVNGSQLKHVIEDYRGRYKVLDSIHIPKNKILIINDDEEKVIECEYIKKADNKRKNRRLF